ncbi:MAG: hypothetical protein LUQ57_05675, partial [Methylococcaceae bacterium]|nr:hypothetical protein [Methylococcaceae bacterium]
MNPADDFIKFYNRNVTPILRDLEPERKALLVRFWTGIISLVASIPGLVLLFRSNQLVFLLTAVPFVIVAIYQFFRYSQKKQAYAAEFKNCVILELVALIDPHLAYFPDRYIGVQDYRESDLFRNRI